MNTPPEFDPTAFDNHVRSAYDNSTPPPPPMRAWAGLQPHLQPPLVGTPGGRGGFWRGGGAGLVLGMLLMAGLGHWRTAPPMPRPTEKVAVVDRATAQATNEVAGMSRAMAQGTHEGFGIGRATAQGTHEAGGVRRTMAQAISTATLADRVTPHLPAVAAGISGSQEEEVPPPVPAVLTALVRTETAYAAAPTDSARLSRARRRVALLTQRTELARLQRRTDSLLLAAGEPGVWAPALDTATVVPPQPLTQRWAVALTFAPERNFFGLGAPTADTLSTLRRTHEQGRAGYNAALLAEYRLTDRLSVGSGLGLSSYGAELRLTDRRTAVTVTYDTAVTTSTQTHQTTTVAFSVHEVFDPHLTPHFNFDGQVIGYDTVWMPRPDTVWTHLVNTDSILVTNRTITPLVTRREEVNARILKPNYRFLTVPFVLRYRLGRATDWTASPSAPRWWADVAVGAQVQVFLGGTQLSTLDGRTYQTERVGARGGPFRPVSVALLGSAALNYALTSRLSASVAPTLRWQAESVYKSSTNLSQKPLATGLQLGLKWAF